MKIYTLNYKDVGLRIKQKRKALSMSQADLATLIGASTQHISNIENARSKISLEKLVSIANVLNCTLDELLFDSIKNCKPIAQNEIAELLDTFTNQELKYLPGFLKWYKKVCDEAANK